MKKIDTCRICFTGSCYKNINNDYFYRGELENYGEMLRATFSILLNTTRSLICDTCINKLREATVFKQKILNSDKYLMEINEDIEEKLDSELELDSDVEIKNEIPNVKLENTTIGLKGQEFVIKLGKTPIKRKYAENYEISDFDNDSIDNGPIPEKKMKKDLKNTEKLKNKAAKNTMEPSKIPQTQKHLRDNTFKLVNNSNLCIFKSLRTKFACTHCIETFFDIQELREHTNKHININKTMCKRMTGLSYKNAEISNLKCRNCEEFCEDLDSLKTHLGKHNITFEGDGKHLLIPYKLDKGFVCVVCQATFYTFTRLSIHMNCHSTQNVCEKCGLSYYNRLSLRNHIKNQHDIKKCRYCHMSFLTISEKAKHLKKIHIKTKRYEKRYCLRCDTTFNYTYQLQQHLIEKHGFKNLSVTCNYCEKVLKSPNNLKTHIRNVHLKERNFSCQICEMRFFTKADKQRHEKTHMDVRSYSCNFCETKFKSKDSVRRHLKRQHEQKLVVCL